MTDIFQNTVTTGELATATPMQVQKRQHSAYMIDSSSSHADPDDANASSATPFSVNSVSPPTHRVESDFNLPVGNPLGAQVENPYRKRAKRTRLSTTQSRIQTIARSIESLVQSFRETSQHAAPSSLPHLSDTSTAGLHSTSKQPGDRGPTPSTRIEHAVLVLNEMLENMAITIKEYRQALNIVKADPVEVSIFEFAIPIMQSDWTERNVQLI